MKSELYNDNFQNYKSYQIPKAQLVIADIPYNIGRDAYGSRLEYYIDGDTRKGPSKVANRAFFKSDGKFNIAEYMHFCNRMLLKEPKEIGKAPCMIVFCAFEQMNILIRYGEKYGFRHNIPLFYIKKSSSQVLKANMRVVGAMEYALILYRDKLPKFNNNHRMILNWQRWERDDKSVPKIHPTQKPLRVLKPLIELFTDKGDVVIAPCAGSGTTLRAAQELGRKAYGFECCKEFYERAIKEMINPESRIYENVQGLLF